MAGSTDQNVQDTGAVETSQPAESTPAAQPPLQLDLFEGPESYIDALINESDSDADATPVADSEPEPKVVTSEPPKAAPVEGAPPAKPAQPPPPAQPAQPAAVVTPPAAPQQYVPPAYTGPTQEQIAQHREGIRSSLEQRYLASFTPQDRELLMTDPATVLAKFASQLYLDFYDGTMAVRNADVARLPEVVQTVVANLHQQNEVEEAFFSNFPDLRKPEYQDQLVNAASFYRRTYPQASVEQIIKLTGTAVRAMYGLIPAEPQYVQNPNPRQAQSPTHLAPHVPTGLHSTRRTMSAPEPLNEFAELALHEYTD